MSPETRAFLASVREAEDPTAHDEQRVLDAVNAAVAGTSAGAAGAALAKGVKGSKSFGIGSFELAGISGMKLGGAIVGLGVAVWLASTALSTRSVESPAAPLVRSPAVPPLEPRIDHGELPQPPTPPPSISSSPPNLSEDAVVPRPFSARPSASSAPSMRSEPSKAPSVRDEIALLTDVRAALDRGDAAEALRRLDGHVTADRQFLAERRAARVFALCALGRTDEARRARSAFLRDHPGSVQRTALERSCAGEKTLTDP